MNSKFTEYVDVFIGTTGNGHALVGPQMPHGMVKLGPDTISLPCGGYDYNDDKIIGFSHTHLQGVGGRGGRGNVLLTAITGEIETDGRKYASKYIHDQEKASVGYYQVILKDYDINVELTATARAGFHRYTFPSTDDGSIIIDVGHTLAYFYNCIESYIEVIDGTNVCGYGIYPIGDKGSSPYTVYFHAEFDTPFDSHILWNGDDVFRNSGNEKGKRVGGLFRYSTKDNQRIQVKVGISYISMEKAKDNLYREIPHWNFEDVAQKTVKTWNELLSRIEVRGGSKEDRIKFYSALYRSLNQPSDYSEYENFHSGVSGKAKTYESEGRRFYSDDWAIWDTFRTTHPLQSIIEPEIQNDMAQTFVRIYEQGGWLPMCTGPNLGYNQTMIGHNAAAVIADIYAKGFRNFDVNKAYEAMKKTSMEQHDDPSFKRLGTPKLYRELGYYPGGDEDTEEDTFSVSLTLEFAYADWCTAQMAKVLGKTEEYEYFIKRAQNYVNLFDPDVGFMRRKHRDGTWVEPFDPSDAFKNGFCETTSWEYTFFVPHDVQGLINLIGGRETFIKKLDDFFYGGYYNYQNETGIQVPYLYSYAGAPWKTQEIVRYYMKERYKLGPAGLYAEDDAGAMSAWYVFSAIGLYPVCPGQGVYLLGSPIFNEIIIRQRNGKEFIIKAVDNSDKNIYIKSAFLDDQPIDRAWLSHEQVINGGMLCLKMNSSPNKAWASNFESAPPSMTCNTPVFEYSNISISEKNIETNKPFKVFIDIENHGALGGETIKVFANDKLISEKIVFLKPGETRRESFCCRLYSPARYTIQIGDQKIKDVILSTYHPPVFECNKIKVSKDFIVHGSEETIKVHGYFRNVGSSKGKKRLYCMSMMRSKMLKISAFYQGR